MATPPDSGANRKRHACPSELEGTDRYVAACRVLLSLIVLLLLVTPWTEGYHLFDNFPHGQDSEVHLLALLAFLGMVLLLARSSNRSISFALTLVAWVQLVFRHSRRVLVSLHRTLPLPPRHGPPLPVCANTCFHFPLLI